METNTARNFALQLGSLIALYVSLSALIMVTFGVINILHPDAANPSQYDGSQQGIRFGIAMLIVFFPTYVFLTRVVNIIRRKETGTYLTLTKWLVYLSLLVGGAILLGDFVAVILTYLNGEITLRFILKAVSLSIFIGAAFYYYILDAKGYWNTHERNSIVYASVASLVILCALVLGFLHSDTPSKTRDIKIDDQEISDLSDMQWRIEDHYRINKTLPQDIAALYIGVNPPQAPTGRDAYEYKITGDLTYQLCASFTYPTQNANTVPVRTAPLKPQSGVTDNPYNNWDHPAGKTCFDRTITPEKTTN